MRVELVLTGLLITRYRAWPEHSWDGGCRTSCMIKKKKQLVELGKGFGFEQDCDLRNWWS